MDGKADLHLHTLCSDGVLTPSELVCRTANCGVQLVSITDHDSVTGLDEAFEAAEACQIEVVPGVELSAVYGDEEVHILGYFIDYRNQGLVDSLAEFREERVRRAERIVDKLKQMNISISMESVLANVTGDCVGRPHIATALVNGGHAESYHQAFSKYIGNGRPAYERKGSFTPEQTIHLIAEAGGLSFLAHPCRSVSEDIILQLVKAGLDGIEVVHPSHTSALVNYYRGIVNEYCLMESGGSDFHGGQRGDDNLLGQITIPTSWVEVMRHRLQF